MDKQRKLQSAKALPLNPATMSPSIRASLRTATAIRSHTVRWSPVKTQIVPMNGFISNVLDSLRSPKEYGDVQIVGELDDKIPCR
mmetsp:Transcript_18554/g.38956  ORF Transcript_18554/g.38956 Transcript_18554/m.38956 type:complete len:85 (-) Transcript_18554:845-1099(-)